LGDHRAPVLILGIEQASRASRLGRCETEPQAPTDFHKPDQILCTAGRGTAPGQPCIVCGQGRGAGSSSRIGATAEAVGNHCEAAALSQYGAPRILAWLPFALMRGATYGTGYHVHD